MGSISLLLLQFQPGGADHLGDHPFDHHRVGWQRLQPWHHPLVDRQHLGPMAHGELGDGFNFVGRQLDLVVLGDALAEQNPQLVRPLDLKIVHWCCAESTVSPGGGWPDEWLFREALAGYGGLSRCP